MKQHAVTIPNEVERIIARWGGDEGEIDLLDFFSELTLYTSSSCLIGRKFRERLNAHIAHLFHDLEKGTDPIAYVDYKADIESFRKRDEARAELVEFIQGVMDERMANPTQDKEDRDLMDVLVQVGFDANTVTGMFISMMFAGHHTTSGGTAAWTLIELLRNPDYMARVYDELDEIYGDTPPDGERPPEYTFAHTRQMPQLENALKEALRLHPPLIILMRVVQKDFHVEDYEISAGQSIAVSPAISNRLPEDFPDADTFDPPDRYDKPRQEDLVNRWTWIPFGAGRHRCVGAQFAIMQLKAIFSVLFQNYEFEMLQPPPRATRTTTRRWSFSCNNRAALPTVSVRTADACRGRSGSVPGGTECASWRPRSLRCEDRPCRDPRRESRRIPARRGRGGRAVLPDASVASHRR